MLKNLTTALTCSSTTFVMGPTLLGFFLWACPRAVSWPLGVVYGLHVLFGNAMHTGSLESYVWRGLDLHLSVMEYFNFRLLVEDDLEILPDRKYVIGTHPHGTYALGQLPFMFTSPYNPLFQLFPFLKDKVHGTGASVVFYIPIVREMFLLAGHIVVSKGTLIRWLSKSHSVGIVVGGEAEVMVTRNNDDRLILRGRKGFIKLALSHGADLLPTYCFHNTDVFHINTTFLQGFRLWLKDNLKISIPVIYGWKGTPFPNPVPLCVAIGAPIQVPQPRDVTDVDKIDPTKEWVVGGVPPDDVVDEYYHKYVAALQKLFDSHKIAAGYPEDRELILLDAPEHTKKLKNAAKAAKRE